MTARYSGEAALALIAHGIELGSLRSAVFARALEDGHRLGDVADAMADALDEAAPAASELRKLAREWRAGG